MFSCPFWKGLFRGRCYLQRKELHPRFHMASPNTSTFLPFINWQVRHVKPLLQKERLLPSVTCPNPLFYLWWKDNIGNLFPFLRAPTVFPLFFLPTLARPLRTIRMSAELSLNITHHKFYGLCSISRWWRTWKTRVIYTSLFAAKILALQACGLARRHKLVFGSSVHCEISRLLQTPSPLYPWVQVMSVHSHLSAS